MSGDPTTTDPQVMDETEWAGAFNSLVEGDPSGIDWLRAHDAALRTQLAEQATQLEIRTAEREESRQTALAWKREAGELREEVERLRDIASEAFDDLHWLNSHPFVVGGWRNCPRCPTGWRRAALQPTNSDTTPPQADTAPREG